VHFLNCRLVLINAQNLGSAVSVERVFSGGRDTIALRRASLNADTIRDLMLVKYNLRRQREHR
jgi:hypothetical protein